MRSNKTIQVILAFLGSLAILIGIGIAFYTLFVLRPKLATLSAQVTQGLGALESSTQALQKNAPLFSASLGGIQTGARMADLLPETLMTLKGTLLQSAELLQASSSTAREVKEGISGLVMPDEELTASARSMRKTAVQLRLMSSMVDQLQEVSFNLTTHTTEISNQLAEIRATLGPLNQKLERARTQIRETQSTLNSFSLPTQVSLAGIGFGGLYVLLGVSLMTLAPIYGRSSRLVQVEYGHPSDPKAHPKQAA